MNSLVKVPPYSKLNFQGKIVFTQNWCNISLNYMTYIMEWFYHHLIENKCHWQWLLRNLSVSCRVNQFLFAIILMWYTRNIYIYIFINWTLHMSDNLPERVQIWNFSLRKLNYRDGRRQVNNDYSPCGNFSNHIYRTFLNHSSHWFKVIWKANIVEFFD
jgi:hypothetical protein